MKRAFSSLARIGAFLLALVIWPDLGATGQRVEIILDGSGSMWGKAGDQLKIDAAKAALKDLIQELELSPESTIGLTAYGHRRKGDCSDIQQITAVPYAERNKLSGPIDGISPKGKTPIADALRVVGESLKGKEEKTSIVLVSDGRESCRKDPCAVARDLRRRYGIGVVIHVVGFDIQEGREQLQCIARAGGGRFLTASDSTELASAFEEVRTEVAKAEPAAAEEPAETPAVARAESLLTTITVAQLNLEGLPKIARVEIYRPDKDPTGPVVVRPVQASKELGKPMVVGTGKYGIWIQPDDGSKMVLLVPDLEISPRERVELDANRLIGAIMVPDPGIDGLEVDWVGIYDPKHDPSGPVVVRSVQTTKSFDEPMMVTPGRAYNVWMKPKNGRPVLVAEGLEPKAGEITVLGQGGN